MTNNSAHNENIIFKTFDKEKAEEDAQNQSDLYNFVTKNLPGPNSQNATKNDVLARQNLDYFDSKGIIYALEKDSRKYLSYCQSIQITSSIIRIGYPWSLENVTNDIKEEIFTKLLDYYKIKYPDRALEFEVYTIDSRWEEQISWLEKHGFKFYCNWLWPIYTMDKIEFPIEKSFFSFEEAHESDFDIIKTLYNSNDDILRFRDLPNAILQQRFSNLIKFTSYHVFLKDSDNVLGFIAVMSPKSVSEPVSIISLLVIEHNDQIKFAKLLIHGAIQFSKNKGFSKAISWFKEKSLFHICLEPYLQIEHKWFHGILKNQ